MGAAPARTVWKSGWHNTSNMHGHCVGRVNQFVFWCDGAVLRLGALKFATRVSRRG